MQEYNFYKQLHVVRTDDKTRIVERGISERELKEKFLRYKHRGYIGACQWNDKNWKIIGEKRAAHISFDFSTKECAVYEKQKEDTMLSEDFRLFAVLGMEKYGTQELEDLLRKTKKVLRLTKFGQMPERIFQNTTLMQPRNCPEITDFFRIFQPYQYEIIINNLIEYMEQRLFPNIGLLRIHYQAMFRLEKELKQLVTKQNISEAEYILTYMHMMRVIPVKTHEFCDLSETCIQKDGNRTYLCNTGGQIQYISLSEELEAEIQKIISIKKKPNPDYLVEALEKVYYILSRNSYHCIRTDEQLAERYGQRTLSDENLLKTGELIKLTLPIIRLLSIVIGAAYTKQPEEFLKIADLPVTLDTEAWRFHTEKALLAEKIER